MKKHRITMTAVLEYDISPKNYEGTKTDEERLASDLENFSDWPQEMLESENCQVTITGEVIDGNQPIQLSKYKLVPEEPTAQMLKATDNTPEEYSEWVELHPDRNKRIYKAMLNAFKGETK